MAAKTLLCNGCNQTVPLDGLDDQGKCPYCGSTEVEVIEVGTPLPSKGDEDIWSSLGYWWSGSNG